MALFCPLTSHQGKASSDLSPQKAGLQGQDSRLPPTDSRTHARPAPISGDERTQPSPSEVQSTPPVPLLSSFSLSNFSLPPPPPPSPQCSRLLLSGKFPLCLRAGNQSEVRRYKTCTCVPQAQSLRESNSVNQDKKILMQYFKN